MKTLVTFYSRTGNTKKMAQILAKELHADIDEIIDKKDRRGIIGWIMGGRDAVKQNLTEIAISKNPSDYDLVIIGTPIWAANSTPAVRTFITQHKNCLKKVAFFTTAGGDSPDKTVKFLEELSGKKALAFTGWLDSEIKQYESDDKLKNFLKEINS